MLELLPSLAGLTLSTGAPKKKAKKAHVRPYYGILQLQNDATPEEIRRNFLLLSRKVHPDRNPSKDAAEKFISLKKAYDTLSDPARRRAYDGGFGSGTVSPEFDAAYEFFRSARINIEDVDAYLDGYRGSVVEEEDLIAYYETHDGDITLLLAYIIGSRDEDVPRYLAFFERAIADGRLDPKYADRSKYPFDVTAEADLDTGVPMFNLDDDDGDGDNDDDGPLLAIQ